MNKAEKALAKKLKAIYYGSSKSQDFSREEELIIERWLVHKLLNEDVFVDNTSLNADHKEYLYGQGYPLHLLVMKKSKRIGIYNFETVKA